jgi:hypothetical protein
MRGNSGPERAVHVRLVRFRLKDFLRDLLVVTGLAPAIDCHMGRLSGIQAFQSRSPYLERRRQQPRKRDLGGAVKHWLEIGLDPAANARPPQ